ncbi:DUF3153 domain-containing protein [Anabaena sp. FACHB-709]|uniref:DUF3153 domain-containing protein n=2 Tax=Nostocaceae TaxID=1162 RepID=A0A1Z4KTI2_ANAVA|nr:MULTISPECIES: DUF3153 domain-containing protein [Nostocaceae]BAY72223.1 hypothetical protein NIES23_50470 [Trichormus variabilis NIES-23]HBW29149.1 DUF3153 domain-containing protein [Nostoc sp. UBA8866]MBD2170617.1 DUF3153 domain-containing protein [Anabaena cylindrica FACHB-318]MBD2262404.1 DUF3153 domain-containing protein [Anabaena sp. FACHB-709]MBD2271951.1 DUF3153 domain-containing protein [Nostoc sp. PCC 7120 = FACHB-418]
MSYGNFGKSFRKIIKQVKFFLSNLTAKNKLRKPIFLLVLLTSLLLTGCVQYDVGVNFDNSNHGQLVQHIKLADRLTSFSGDYVYEWLTSIERRARKLEGNAKRISPEEVIVTIPFSNGQELQTKFNEFFNSRAHQTNDTEAGTENSEFPKVESNLLLTQNNFLLVVRNQLIYDLDLRSLSLIANKGNVLTDTGSILDLKFALKTPWGAKSIQRTETAVPPEKQSGQLVWRLQPGELNHIEVVFWLPSPLGIGALLIVLFVWGGFYLRYTFMPDPKLQLATKSAVAE